MTGCSSLRTMTHISFRIAAARRMLYRNGCDSGVGGHVSARDPRDGGATFWISPFEYFDETTPDTVVRSTMDLTSVDGLSEVSPAVRFHAAIYRRRPDVAAVVHTHSRYIMAVGTTGSTVGMFSSDACVFYQEQVVFEETTEDIVNGDALAKVLGENRAIILKNHGA